MHSKKSEHYTSAEGYRDMDGLHKQFTFIDHDVKTSISTTSPAEIEDAKKQLQDYKEKTIQSILCFPAVNVVRNPFGLYEEFIERNIHEGCIEWNENVLRGAIMVNLDLGRRILDQLWKTTVQEAHWYEDMSHDDIIAGKWKDLI